MTSTIHQPAVAMPYDRTLNALPYSEENVDAAAFAPLSRQVGAERLTGDRLGNGSEAAQVLFLHGAGQSNRNRAAGIRRHLWQRGVGSVAFDFSGHGESSSCTPGSLVKRYREACDWWSLMHEARARCVVASSMGAEAAIRLSATPGVDVTHLVLVVGAVYAGAAFELPFGPAFSACIRAPSSWRDAPALEMLRRFRGHLTIIAAQQDQVIPPDLPEIMAQNAISARAVDTILLIDMAHDVMARCEREPARAAEFGELIAQQLLI